VIISHGINIVFPFIIAGPIKSLPIIGSPHRKVSPSADNLPVKIPPARATRHVTARANVNNTAFVDLPINQLVDRSIGRFQSDHLGSLAYNITDFWTVYDFHILQFFVTFKLLFTRDSM